MLLNFLNVGLRREAVAARSAWEVVGIYEDAGISGSNGREKRPGLDRLLKDATARRINVIAAPSIRRSSGSGNTGTPVSRLIASA